MTVIAAEYQRYQKSSIMKELAAAAHGAAYVGQTSSATYLEVKDRLVKFQRLKGSRLLDAGCGNGSLSRLIAKDLQFEVIGIDLSQELIQEASLEKDASCRFLAGDFSVMENFPKESIDIILSIGSLYWGQSLSEVFAKWHEISTQMGRLLIFTNLLYGELSLKEKEALANTQFIPARQCLHALSNQGWIVAEWFDATAVYIDWLNRWCLAMKAKEKSLIEEMGEINAAQLITRFTTYKDLAERKVVRRIIIEADYE